MPNAPNEQPKCPMLPLIRTRVFTGIVLGSSVPIAWADKAIDVAQLEALTPAAESLARPVGLRDAARTARRRSRR